LERATEVYLTKKRGEGERKGKTPVKKKMNTKKKRPRFFRNLKNLEGH